VVGSTDGPPNHTERMILAMATPPDNPIASREHAELVASLSAINTGIATLRGEVQTGLATLGGELRTEIAKVRTEIATLAGELRTANATLDGRLDTIALRLLVRLGGGGVPVAVAAVTIAKLWH
jgi:hypothetical protein